MLDSQTASTEPADPAPPQPTPLRDPLEARRSGRACVKARDWLGAETAWRDLLAVVPGDVEAAGGLADSLLRQRRLDEAEAALVDVVAEHPLDRRVAVPWALLAQAKRRFREAERRWRALLAADPTYISADLQLGITYFALKEYGKARRHLLKVREIAPQRADLALPLARYLALTGDIGPAIETYRRHIEATRDPGAALELAEILVAGPEPQRAADLLRDDMLDSPALAPRHWAVRARIESRGQRWNAAGALLRAYSDDGASASELSKAAWGVLLDLPDEPRLRKILLSRLAPAIRPALTELLVLARAERRPDIEAALIETVGDPGDHATQFAHLHALSAMREYDAAIELGQQGVKAAAEDPLGWRALIQAQQDAGDWAGVVATEQSRSARAPASARDDLLLGVAEMELGDCDAARTHLLAAIRSAPNDPRPVIALARVYETRGRYLQAETTCRQAVASDGGEDAQLALGRLLVRLGRAEEGVEAFRAALAVAANPLPAIRELQALGELGRAWEDHLIRLQARIAPALTAADWRVLSLGYGGVDSLAGLDRADQGLIEQPLDPGLLAARAASLRALGRLDEALRAAGLALDRSPFEFAAVDERLTALCLLRRYDEATDVLSRYRAYACSAEFLARHRTVLVELAWSRGDFANGFALLANDRLGGLLRRRAATPVSLAGDDTAASEPHLLLAEGTIADEILLARAYPALAERSGLRVGGHRWLVDLFQRSFGFARFLPVERWPEPGAFPDAEHLGVYAGLPTLELATIADKDAWRRVQASGRVQRVGNMLAEAFPGDTFGQRAAAPYLLPHAARRLAWRQRLAQSPGQLKVGVAPSRKANPDEWRPLLERPGVDYILLTQPGPRQAWCAWSPLLLAYDEVFDAVSLDEAAALMAELDLVVANDAGLAELAGALGVETWRVHTREVPGWRVGPDGRDRVHGSLSYTPEPPAETEADAITRIAAALVERLGAPATAAA